MNRVESREQFLRRYEAQDIDCSSAIEDPRLQGVDITPADRNGDGRIAGQEELAALYDTLERGLARADGPTRDRRRTELHSAIGALARPSQSEEGGADRDGILRAAGYGSMALGLGSFAFAGALGIGIPAAIFLLGNYLALRGGARPPGAGA